MGLFGFSHNAEGRGEQRGDIFCVTEIVEVRSCDLVTDPATVKNLWESNTVKITFKQLIESAPKLAKKIRRNLVNLAEDYGMEAMPMDAAGASENVDPRELLGKAIAALVQSADEADHELAQKVMKLLKPESDTPSLEEDDETDAEGKKKEKDTMEEDDSEDEDKKKKDASESRKHKAGRGTQLTEAKAKKLCEIAGLAADKALLESIVGVDEDKAMALLAWAKKDRASHDQTPRTGSFTEQRHEASPLKFDGQSRTKSIVDFLRTGKAPSGN